ncbi:unnamed protein product [Brassica rapa subsp. narinosa]
MHMQRTLLHCKKMSEHEVFKNKQKKKKNIGRLKLSAVRLYAKQLLIYLKHPKNCAVNGLLVKTKLHTYTISCYFYKIVHSSFPWLRNNDILRLHMELKGPFPKKMLRKFSFKFNTGDYIISSDLSFNATEGDSVSGKVTNHSVYNIYNFYAIYAGEDIKRLSVSHALAHTFITGK